MEKFGIGSGLKPETPLYRYINLESFLSLIESKQISLTNIMSWDDPWEGILSRVPVENERGERRNRNYSPVYDIYGQCWSRIKESDAMWRIYSPTKTGIQIATSAEKFKLIEGITVGYLGEVVYFEDAKDLVNKSNASKHHIFFEALYKRSAFAHEEEVRLLTHRNSILGCELGQAHVTLPVDIFDFIEGITIDPRAEDWYVRTIARYCDRVGLTSKPVKSSLYEPDPHLKANIVTRWVPVKDIKDENCS